MLGMLFMDKEGGRQIVLLCWLVCPMPIWRMALLSSPFLSSLHNSIFCEMGYEYERVGHELSRLHGSSIGKRLLVLPS